jgi:hypothetical protein
VPRLRAEASALNARAWTWTLSAAAGAALAAFAGLLGRWSASPALGWTLALAAAAAGYGASRVAAAPADEEDARAWAAGGALAALAVPALLRLIELSLPDPSLLIDPLGGRARAAFVLGQAALLAAAASGAWTRAARGSWSPAAALAGGAAAAYAARAAGPALPLAVAALAVLAAATLAEAPWKRRDTGVLRARTFAAAAALGLCLATAAPALLPVIWMARLHAAYPGGAYLAIADDGASWAAYRFSNGTATILRDGVTQTPDPATVRLALRAVLGQRDDGGSRALLLVRPPEPLVALTAQNEGAFVTIVDGTPAQTTVFDALGGGPAWRKVLVRPAALRPSAALIFLPKPRGVERGLAGREALKALRAKLVEGSVAAVLLPPGSTTRDVDGAAADAAAVFGRAQVADLPKGFLVMASTGTIVTDPELIYSRLQKGETETAVEAIRSLTDGILWRAAPSEK